MLYAEVQFLLLSLSHTHTHTHTHSCPGSSQAFVGGAEHQAGTWQRRYSVWCDWVCQVESPDRLHVISYSLQQFSAQHQQKRRRKKIHAWIKNGIFLNIKTIFFYENVFLVSCHIILSSITQVLHV